jgi:hypothetical protein
MTFYVTIIGIFSSKEIIYVYNVFTVGSKIITMLSGIRPYISLHA